MSQLRRTDRQSHDQAGMLLEDERTRTSKMVARSASENRASVKKMMGSLQQRFSNTGDISPDIAALIEEQVQLRTRELFRQANYDSLTHLPNRHFFSTTLENLIIESKKQNQEFSLLFLDLDGFKAINDNLGHQAGDELLQNVAARLISSVRDGDIVSRRGGDEFVILLKELSDKEDITNICQRMINEVSRPYFLGQKEGNISTSIGVARYPMDGKTPSEILENSDAALYASKESGRKTFRFYDAINADIPEPECTVELEDELTEAMQNGQIEICFEPQVELVSGQVIGASATAYWNNPKLATPYLTSWNQQLVKSGWSQSVATWLLDSSLYYLNLWKSVRNEWVISVPILDSLWLHQDLVAFLDDRLQTYKVQKEQLQLEFSLGALQKLDGKLKQTLLALGKSGYQITLTDVGAFPLDLGLLARLQLNEIKLDRDWVHESMKTDIGQAWLQGLVQLAKGLDICVIASGLDSKEQARKLQQWGCVIGQGLVWSKPVEAARFNQHLMARHRLGA